MSGVPEAQLKETDAGLMPESEGWYVVNARDARWWRNDRLGQSAQFEGEPEFPEVGFNLHVLLPGQPNGMYHGESGQEDFLVLSGECVLVLEGEERRLKAWDFVHCPPMAEHIFVGAGEGPCVIVMAGRRKTAMPMRPATPSTRSPRSTTRASSRKRRFPRRRTRASSGGR